MQNYLAQYDWPKIRRHVTIAFCALSVLFAAGYVPLFHNKKVFAPTTRRARATYQFTPIGGAVVLGNDTVADNGLAASSSAAVVNVGGWRGTIAQDGYWWGFTSTATGYKAYIDLGDVQLNGANKIIVQTGMKTAAAAQAALVQVCDWVSSTGVSSPADAQCTGGGWRNLNLNDATVSPTAIMNYDWEFYDGYWNGSATSSISTPLSNFVNGSKTMRIRYYSTGSASGSLVGIDFLRARAVVDPLYSPSGATLLNGSTVPGGDYAMTNIAGTGQATSSSYFRVLGTASSPAAYYLSFKNVNTYPGANTFLVRSEYSCNTASTTLYIAPRIYNFATGQWENLTTANIACATTDAVNAWAKTPTSIGDYISGGEVRVGWFANNPSASIEVRTNMQYLMLGATYSGGPSARTYGTVSSGATSSVSSLDMTGTLDAWNLAAVAKASGQAFSFWGYDNDGTATAGRAVAANINVAVNVPAGAAVTGELFASRMSSGNTTARIAMGIGDPSGNTAVQGGWTQLGPVVGNRQTYADSVTASTVGTGGSAGWSVNADDFVDTVGGRMNLRLRTATTVNTTFTAAWDFGMVALQWTEDGSHPTISSRFDPNGGALVTGTVASVAGLSVASTTAVVNVGDWRGAEAQDGYWWGWTGNSSTGFNAYIDVGPTQLNGANKIIVQTGFKVAAAAQTTFVQVCDWVSSTGVANAADAQCTGGGWRNLNLSDVAVAPTTATAYDWEIYDGYWAASPTTPLSTPLSNFVNSTTKALRIRYYSPVGNTGIAGVDFIRAFAVVNPIYGPSGVTLLSPGDTMSGGYASTTYGGAGQTGVGDNMNLSVGGSAATTTNFYLSYRGVKTYPGANAVLVHTTYVCNAVGLMMRPEIYNFTTQLWEDIGASAFLCPNGAGKTNAWVKSGIADIGDYVSGGEIRIGWYGSVNSLTLFRIDQQYIMLGTTYTSGANETTLGSISSGAFSDTASLDTASATASLNIAGVTKSTSQSTPFYGFDNDGTATAGTTTAANVDLTMNAPQNTEVTGLFYAANFSSGAAGTVQLGIKDYSGFTSTMGGWIPIGATAANTLTYTDNIMQNSVASGGAAGMTVNPQDCIDTVAGTVNMRLRTSVVASAATVAQWDFVMASLQWIEIPTPPQSLTFSISTTSVGFSTLEPNLPSYATADGNGSSTEVVAHTITVASNGSGGYVLQMNGTPLSNGANQLVAIGAIATTSQIGTSQFGMRLSAVGGMGQVLVPYNDPVLYAFDAAGMPDIIAQNAVNDSAPTTYSVRYLANVPGDQPAGQYTTAISYSVTSTF